MNVSVIYLAQNYTGSSGIPITIRKNISYLVIFLLASKKDLKAILSDASAGYTPDELLSVYNYATSRKIKNTNMPMPLLIDIIETDRNKKFRTNLNEFIPMPPPVAPAPTKVTSRSRTNWNLSNEMEAASVDSSYTEDLSPPRDYENIVIGMGQVDLNGDECKAQPPNQTKGLFLICVIIFYLILIC
jgi:hypothetical protein